METMETNKENIIDKYLNIINDKFNLILCVILFIGVTAIFLLLSQVDERMTQNIIQIRGYIITVYGVLVGLLITYIISKTIQTREERIRVFNDYVKYTQKLHKFRAIINANQ